MRSQAPQLFLLLLIGSLLWACRKDNINTGPGATLEFSTDTLTFDTVFVQRGSVTGRVKAINRSNKDFVLSEVKLNGLSNGQFTINVDGVSQGPFREVLVPSNDSIYIFVTVNIDPTSASLPFVVRDDIEFFLNGNLQTVHLMAWGQNARYLYGATICDSVWTNGLPYVIIPRTDSINGEFNPGVVVEENCTLRIQAGTQVYFEGNASGMFVRGTLIVEGSKNDSVVFQGSRLENFFEDIPGQWLGIFIYRGSTGNRMEHLIMNESRFGLTVGVLDTSDLTLFDNASRPDLELESCIFKNNFSNALFAFNAEVHADNCLFDDGTDVLVTLALGGEYTFDNCTFHNRADIVTAHDEEILLLSNFAGDNQATVVNRLDSARFTNCIIWGSLEEELNINRLTDSITFNYQFEHCLLKTALAIDSIGGFDSCLINQNPLFEDVGEQDYRLQATSPAVDVGIDNGLTTDLDDALRPQGGGWDIGAYER